MGKTRCRWQDSKLPPFRVAVVHVRTVKKGSLADVQREYVIEVLKQSKSKGEAIKILGISRATLWRLIQDYGIKDEIKD